MISTIKQNTNQRHKQYIPDFTLNELIDFVKSIGEKEYRAKQIFECVHQRCAADFREMTNLSKALQNTLVETADISRLILLKDLQSDDGARKFLFTLRDGYTIETVYIPENQPKADPPPAEKRKTLCISSQVGCALKCSFCATGMMGFYRNLSAGEIIDQFLTAARIIGEKITNVVFMGMGEPFMNYDNVLKAADIINDPNGYGLGVRHITISTIGLIHRIEQFLSEGKKYKLALSINAGTQSMREVLMPITKKHPLSQVSTILCSQPRKNRRPVTLEYVLLKDLNDTDREIDALITFAKPLYVKINLIPYNPVDSAFSETGEERTQEIYRKIRSAGIHTNIRKSLGSNIQAACGQLFAKQSATKMTTMK